MATDIRTEAMPPSEPVSPTFALPPAPVAATAAPPKAAAKKPAKVRFRIRPAPEPGAPDVVEDLLSPTSIRGFAWSMGGHALLLTILALWYFSPKLTPHNVIDTRLEAGSEFGDPLSEQMTGAKGMDELPNMPVPDAVIEPPSHTITATPAADLKPTITASYRGAAIAGGGASAVNLRNPQGGNGDGFGVAKFGQGGENINGVDVKVGDPQFTLIWDSRADIDLHVLEPGGSEIYWEDKRGTQGGDLDVDDVDGFGPENVNYQAGLGPAGSYKWFVHYYGGAGGIAQPTRWKVRVKHAGKVQTFEGRFMAIGQKSKVYDLKVTRDGTPAPSGDPRQAPEGREITTGAAMPAATTPVAAAPAPAAGPRVFGPAGAGFSVSLPAEPKPGRREVMTPAGPAVAATFGVERSEGMLEVSTIDFPSAALSKTDPAKFLDDLAASSAAEQKGKPRRTTQVSVSGGAGREVEMDMPESVVSGGGVGRMRVFLSGTRAVRLSAVGTKAYVDSPEVADAFRTLKLDDAR